MPQFVPSMPTTRFCVAELLTNAAKHSYASMIKSLDITSPPGGPTQITVHQPLCA